MSNPNKATPPTPEERAQHVIDATLWQHLDHARTMNQSVFDEIRDHIAAEIRAAIAEVQRWIPVSERLPDDNQLVLAYASHGWVESVRYRDRIPFDMKYVTHWQPLPPAPTKVSA